jgi:hypothetical protein
VLGNATNRRRLVDAGAALAAYAAADPKAEIEREAYLSAFWFADDFRRHLEATRSSKGYDGVCWAPFLWFDIDHPDDPERALSDARRLASAILYRYPAALDDDLLLFFSGHKGYHVGLPTFWGPEPSVTFHRVARRLAETVAAAAGVSIDAGVYDKVRLFRAPNSRHPKTGLHKRRLSLKELLHLTPERVRRLAAVPGPFALPSVTATDERAAADWQAALQAVEQGPEGKAQRRAAVEDGAPRLNRATLAFIRGGADQGDRHRLLFSAAANLAEFGCPPALAHALLSEAALDSGLPPADVRRQIDCGLARAVAAAPPAPSTAPTPAPEPTDRQRLANLWGAAAPVIGPYGPEGGRR